MAIALIPVEPPVEISGYDAYWAYRGAGGVLQFHKWVEAEKPTGPTGDEETTPADRSNWEIYRASGGTLAFEEWLAQGQPGELLRDEGDVGGVEGPGDPEFLNEWNAYRANGGSSTYPEWEAAGKPTGPTPEETGDPIHSDRELYDNYVKNGGTLSYADWIGQNKPPPPPPDGGNGDGVVTDGEEDFSAQLAAAMEGIRQESREAYEARRAEAQRLGARDIGKMSRMQQQGLLARGRSAGEIEQLMAGGQEAGARSLNDLLQALSVGQKERQAEIGRMGIGAMISGEELGIRERQLAQQETQYQQTFGLSQQQLAQQAQYQQGQLGLGRQQAQASIWGPLAGALGTIGGGALGSIFGPAGTAIGSALGTWVGPGGGGWFGGRG